MMDGFCVEYIYDNDVHLDYSQLYMHPRTLKDLPSGPASSGRLTKASAP